jgi:thiosulfate dehydrogenase [quinone] large subunit
MTHGYARRDRRHRAASSSVRADPSGVRTDASSPPRIGIPAAVVLPLRLFLGATFLYAGLQKLLDPAFFSDGAPGYIGEQLRGYVRAGSPLSPLLTHLAIPHASLIGTLVALAEMWIGLSTLAGLLSRAGALGGMLLSLTFFLTASWSVHPYFLGPDLPYAAAWFTLFLTGPGPYSADGYLSGAAARRSALESPTVATGGALPWPGTRISGRPHLAPAGSAPMTRLSFLANLASAVALTALSTGIAAAVGKRTTPAASSGGGGSQLAATGSTQASLIGNVGSSRHTPTATATTASKAADVAPPAGYIKLGNVGGIPVNSAARYTDPVSGDPGILIHLPDDSWVAYDAICPHAGCTVRYAQSQRLLRCPCHGAEFDPTANGTAVSGPTNRPLAALTFKIDAGGDFYAKSR